MANKIVAVFVLCIVLIASVHVQQSEAVGVDKFADCFNTCKKECQAGGNGSSFCEMKCDTDCQDKETADLLSQP